MDLPELTAAYLAHFQKSHSRSSCDTWAFWLAEFGRFWQESRCQPPVRLRHLKAFQKRIETTPGAKGRMYAPPTVYLGMRAVQGLFRWAFEQGHLAEDPAHGRMVMSPPPRRVMPILSPSEVFSLLGAAPPRGPLGLRDRTLLETFLGTRLLVSYATELQLDHLDLAQGVLHDLHGRPHFFGKRLRDLFERYLAQSRPCLVYREQDRRLFAGEKGGHLAMPTTCLMIQRYADLADLGRPVTAATLSRSGPALGAEFHERPFPNVDASGPQGLG